LDLERKVNVMSVGETNSAKARRTASSFFENYCQGTGIDIGAGRDPLFPDIATLDQLTGGDAYKLDYPDAHFDYVYSSHCLEHLTYAKQALREWHRALKTGGRLVLFLPDRDNYEHKNELPSTGNADHKHYWTLFSSEPPCTFGLVPLLLSMGCWDVVYAQKCEKHGEYSIEVVAVKLF
jgi:SAM-dependent methyltransferase